MEPDIYDPDIFYPPPMSDIAYHQQILTKSDESYNHDLELAEHYNTKIFCVRERPKQIVCVVGGS